MDNRTWSSGASGTPPTVPASPSVGYPTPGNPELGQAATKGGAYWFHQMGEELRAILTAAGITPDPTVLTQLLTALRSAGVFTTPAQFDNTTKAATTAFVRASGLQAAGTLVVFATSTLTSANVGKATLINVNSSVQTLPLGSTLPDGALIALESVGLSNTIQRQGTDGIYTLTGTPVTSLAMGQGDTLQLVWSAGAANWIIIGGSAALQYAGLFGSSIAVSGYQKLPSGLIIQWGTGTGVVGAGATYNFPIAFPTNCRAVIATAVATANMAVVQESVPTTTSFTFGVYNTSNARTAQNIEWFAIGY